jgi:hypothetical protein
VKSNQWVAVWVVVALCGASTPGLAETYNFYFQKKGPAEAPAPATPQPQPQPQLPAPVAVPAESTAVAVRPEAPSRWRLALSLFVSDRHFHGKDEFGQSIGYSDDGAGGLATLLYDLGRLFAVSLYAGPRGEHRMRVHVGGDLEFVPLRLAVSARHNLLELGILAGASTAMWSPTESGPHGNPITFHAGGRFILNIVPEFGLTIAMRVNLGYGMGEAGILARL